MGGTARRHPVSNSKSDAVESRAVMRLCGYAVVGLCGCAVDDAIE